MRIAHRNDRADRRAPVHGRAPARVASRRVPRGARESRRRRARNHRRAGDRRARCESASVGACRAAPNHDSVRTAESIAARRAAASAEAACRASESPAATIRRVAESTAPISRPDVVEPCRAALRRQHHHRSDLRRIHRRAQKIRARPGLRRLDLAEHDADRNAARIDAAEPRAVHHRARLERAAEWNAAQLEQAALGLQIRRLCAARPVRRCAAARCRTRCRRPTSRSRGNPDARRGSRGSSTDRPSAPRRRRLPARRRGSARGSPALRSGAQRDREVVGAAASLQRLRGDESPLQLAAEPEELAQPVVLRLERRDARRGERERVAPQLLALRRQIRAAPASRRRAGA